MGKKCELEKTPKKKVQSLLHGSVCGSVSRSPLTRPLERFALSMVLARARTHTHRHSRGLGKINVYQWLLPVSSSRGAARQHLLYEPFLVTKRLCTIAITAMTMATDGARLAGVGRPSVYVVFVLPGHAGPIQPQFAQRTAEQQQNSNSPPSLSNPGGTEGT